MEPTSPTLVGTFLPLSHQRNHQVYEANFFQQFYAPEYKIPVNVGTFFHDNEIIFYIKLPSPLQMRQERTIPEV